jgi:transaldolase / glucose-6-phosphate isomerase
MSKLNDLHKLGQSIWLDDIRRAYFSTGELNRLVELGLRGLTSNPTIFEKAIAGSADYDVKLRELVRQGKPVTEIYEALAIDDIRAAADALHLVYDQSGGADGFVSLEVSPTLAHDSQGTAEDAGRLFKLVDRPNLMIKIPATPEGLPAVEHAISNGINVNVTLIFSVSQYEAVVEAFMSGLEKLAASGGDVKRLGSVASFFVSRVDTALDKQLEALGEHELQGKIAVANAQVAYGRFQELFASPRWEKLSRLGAHVQRPLWASTGTKNPAYSDTLYVDELIGPHTVNTLPPATLQAVLDHGRIERTIDRHPKAAFDQIARLAELGIDLGAVTQKLLDDGVAAFAKSFESLLDSIGRKRENIRSGEQGFSASLGQYQPAVDAALAELDRQKVIQRIWEGDYTVWKPAPVEISNRLGWLHIAEEMLKEIPCLQSLAESVRAAGYTQGALLGMGGSSLAPEVFRKTFGVRPGYLDLVVLDSTDPAAVLGLARGIDPAKTLFVVSTKSGGTVETFSFFKFFYNQVADKLGVEQAGAHFIAITDPGSDLVKLGEQYHFRATFLNNPNIGGRYSALSHFGLVAAALVGVDLSLLLHRALGMADYCARPAPAIENHAARLGAILGELAKAGHDKFSLVASPALCPFGDWAEQLLAESTGKEGQGILPVVGEVVGDPQVYGADRLFVYLRLADDHTFDTHIKALELAGQPVVRLEIEDLYDLGGQFFLWELATALAGNRLGINPFDQPNVESAKVQARKMVAAYQEQGKLPALQPVLQTEDILVFGDVHGDTLAEIWSRFLAQAAPGAYITLQAYLPPSLASDASLLALRGELRQRTRLAVTSGYGPRFLHSTGQLHKGDAGHGLFVQITADPVQDAPIPDVAGKPGSSISFGVLELAQALGDRQALLENGRKLIRFHLSQDVQVGLARLLYALKG